MLDEILILIFVYFIGRALYAVCRIVQELYVLKELDLAERYGRGSFAVVTGPSDGIGLEFAVQLAKRGFNIVMIARNAQKMAEKEQLIKAANPSVQVIKVEFDFTNSASVEKLEAISEMLRDVDVSVVVNSVRISTNNTPLLDMEMQNSLNMIVVNCLPQTIFNRLFIPKLKARTHKSAVIDVSSVASNISFPGKEIYSATKYYNRSFTSAICTKADTDKIDFLSLKPGFVTTPLTFNRPNDWITCNTAECVNGALRALGHKQETYGSNKHVLFGTFIEFIFTVIPNELLMKHRNTLYSLFKYKAFGNAKVAK